MPGLGLVPNAPTYVSLLCVYAKHGDITAIIEQIDRLKSDGMPLLPKFYLEIIYHLCVNGHVQHVDTLLKEISQNYELHEDIINVILTLVTKGLDEAALQIVTSYSLVYSDKSMFTERGKAFIRQLVKMKRPTEIVLNYCQQMDKLGFDYQVYLFLVRETADRCTTDDVLFVLRQLKQRNVNLSQGYFSQLFPADDSKTLELLRILKDEFDFKLNAQFMREKVVPNLELKDPINTVQEFRSAHASQFAAATSVAYACLRRNRLKEATDVTTYFKAFLQPLLFAAPLVSALVATRDFESYTKFVHNLKKNYEQPHLDRSEALFKPHVNDAVGSILFDTIFQFGAAERAGVAEKILPAFLAAGIQISKIYADRVRQTLGSNISEQTDMILDYITGDLRTEPNEETATDESTANQSEDDDGINASETNQFKQLQRSDLDLALESQDIDLIRKEYNKLRGTARLNLRMMIPLLNAFKHANSLPETKEIILELLRTNNASMIPDLTDVLRRFAAAGDIEMIDEIGRHLTHKQRFNASFNASLAYAYFTSGKGEALLDVLSKQLDEAQSEEELSDLAKSFPSRRLLFVLDRNVYLNKKCKLIN